MKYTICDVRVSELLTKQVSVPPWEVAILEALHPNSVKEVGEEEIDRDPPSPEDEYQRLCNKYRGNKEDANSVVAMIYGPFEAGIRAIEQEMRNAGIDVQPYSRSRKEDQRPAVRSSRMSVGIRDREARRQLDSQAVRTAGVPGRVRPTGIAPSNADPALGQDIGQQSRLRRAERVQQTQGPQPLATQQRRADLQPSYTGDQGLEQRKQEARQARQKFLQQQPNAAPPSAARGRPAPAVRPR